MTSPAVFRKQFGVSPVQHFILKNMKNGEFRDSEGWNGGTQQLHRLVTKGLLEFVSDNPEDKFWRLTAKGKQLVDSWL